MKTIDLLSLVKLFYDAPEALGDFQPVEAAEVPEPYRQLLAHTFHMTVTLEAFHGSAVDVQVLKSAREGDHYFRNTLLTRRADDRVVQFGIMRIDLSLLALEVRQEIEAEQLPMGHVLIAHRVLREIRLVQLWRITPSEELARLFQLPAQLPTYGRTAWIDCHGQAAVELLEIVSPVEELHRH